MNVPVPPPLPFYPAPQPRPRSSLGLVSLACGLVALLIGWVPLVGFVGLVAAIIGVITGAKALQLRKRGYDVDHGLATAGIALSGLVLFFVIGFLLLFASLLAAA